MSIYTRPIFIPLFFKKCSKLDEYIYTYFFIILIIYIYTIYKENYPFQHTFGLDFSFQKYP